MKSALRRGSGRDGQLRNKTHRLDKRHSLHLDPLRIPLRQELSTTQHEMRALHRHKLTRAITRLRAQMVGILRQLLRFVPDGRPARNMHVDALAVLVVAQQGLQMLPAVEAADARAGKGRLGHARQALGLPVAPDGALDGRGHDFAAVEHDGARRVDEGLRDVEAVAGPFRVAEHDEDAGFLDGGADAVHFGGVAAEAVGHVFLGEGDVGEFRVGPDRPGRVCQSCSQAFDQIRRSQG